MGKKVNTGIKLWQLLVAISILFGTIGLGFFEIDVEGIATNPKAVAQVQVKEWKLETFYRRSVRSVELLVTVDGLVLQKLLDCFLNLLKLIAQKVGVTYRICLP